MATKKSDFHWTTEAEEAFKQMKQLMSELPMLTAPMEKGGIIDFIVETDQIMKRNLGYCMMECDKKKSSPESVDYIFRIPSYHLSTDGSDWQDDRLILNPSYAYSTSSLRGWCLTGVLPSLHGKYIWIISHCGYSWAGVVVISPGVVLGVGGFTFGLVLPGFVRGECVVGEESIQGGEGGDGGGRLEAGPMSERLETNGSRGWFISEVFFSVLPWTRWPPFLTQAMKKEFYVVQVFPGWFTGSYLGVVSIFPTGVTKLPTGRLSCLSPKIVPVMATLRSPELGSPAIYLPMMGDSLPTISEDPVRSQLSISDDSVLWLLLILPLRKSILDKWINIDDPLGGSFHASPPRSTQAPPAGHTSGGAEDLITLTVVSSVVSTLVQKVNSLETELKDTKKLFKDVVGKLVKKVKAIEVKLKTKKRKVVVSDSDQEEGGEQDVDLDALLALANAAVIVDSNIPPGGASSSHIPTDVPTGVAPTGVSNKGKTPMVEEDITVKERTLKQMEDDRLGEEAAKRLHDEEQAQVNRQRAELNRKRQQEVLASAMYYTEADWINIIAWVEANASLSKILLGDDVTEDNFLVRMAALIKRKKQALAEKLAKEKTGRPMTPIQQRTYMRQFVKNQSSALYSTRWTKAKVQAFSRTLKRTGPELEEPSSKQQKSTEAPIPSVPDVPQPPIGSSPKSSGTRRKSLGRNHLTKPKSILKELDLDADDKTFIKVVSDEDSTNEASILWSALAGWEVISTPLGEINGLYRSNQSTKHFTTLRGILHMGDLQVLMDSQEGGKGSFVWNHQPLWQIRSWRLYTLSNVHVLETVSGEVLYMFADVSYPLSVKLMERMLKHKLEIDKDVVGNDMTTAEQLIRFIKNQIAAAQVSPV
ncbi:hypothetical protein Tco_0782827 [Tanacetum coccineum]